MAEKKEKSSSAKATEDKQIFKVRHSLSHLLATAVLEKYPQTRLGIGPVIENGFYYDFDFKKPLSESDLPSLEEKIRELIKEKIVFKKKSISPAEGRKLFKKAPYKLQLVNELVKAKKPLSIYVSGKFIDLCSGPHVKNTSQINPEAFKLTSLAGAYWKGSEKNPMLTRIYGVAFGTKKELTEYLKNEEEAKRRDHRKIGKEMELFYFDDLVGKGLPLWLPNGTIIKNEIERLVVETEEKYGYLRVSTPHLAKEEMYVKSGHLPYYKDSMYPPMKIDDGTYYLKAMNCPHHHVIYRSRPRSYKELPLRLAEYGTVYRNELSGTLAGLLRVRSLQMNDAHIYCAKDQIADEFKKVLELTLYFFKLFGLKDHSFRLSKWGPKNKEKYINEPANWKYSEGILRKILKELKVKFVEASDEAAFYGPKVDVQLKSIVGREETMSTIQLDFAAKKRFNLTYKDKNGRDNNEIFVIHRAPLSTHERFIAFLIEHYAGEFPTWLAPVQVEIIPISDKQSAYARQLYEKLRQENIRVSVADDNETLGKRIRGAEIKKIPYILVAGEREVKSETVNVRSRRKGQLGEIDFEKFLKDVKKEVEERK
jgi:threonyl-tRNA synthetase